MGSEKDGNRGRVGKNRFPEDGKSGGASGVRREIDRKGGSFQVPLPEAMEADPFVRKGKDGLTSGGRARFRVPAALKDLACPWIFR
jgi:hypothetical protein